MFMFEKRKFSVICLAVALAMFAAGCKKKVPAPPPPPPPAPAPTPTPTRPPAPSVAFSAEPTSIQRGQASTLRWQVSGEVTSVSIDQGIGTVQNTGNRRVPPDNSATYTLTATGPGGTSTGAATVNVSSPPPPAIPPTPTVTRSLEQRLDTDVQDAFFDYDKSDIRPDARDALTRNAAALKGILADFPN